MQNRKVLLTAIAGAAASLAAPAHALTVGEAKVLSYTDQPLRVLIPIKAQGWEWKALWASAQTYQRGLGLSAMLYKPVGEKTDGFIEIRSQSPITDPIVDLQITFDTGHRTTIHRTPILIDVQHEGVAIQRPDSGVAPSTAQGVPYQAPSHGRPPLLTPPGTALVDPSVVHSVAPTIATEVRASDYKDPPSFPPQSLRASQDNAVSVERFIPEPPSLNSGSAHAVKPSASSAKTYLVKKGDGLYAIVSKFKPALWSHDEAMQHVYAQNTHAFASKKYNTLKAGATLTIDFGSAHAEKVESTPEPQYQQVDRSPVQASPSTRAAPKEFTEEDLLAAVQRHRMEKLQAELKRLQGGTISGR